MSTIVDRAASFFEGADIRPIDRARFRHHFQGAPIDTLIKALRPYQNEDGGFGHNLEVDIKAPQSNPFASELALTAMIWADMPHDWDILVSLECYLENTQNLDGCWSFSPEIYEHELAPWFKGWTFPNLNPAATTAGLLRQLGIECEGLYGRVETLFQERADPYDLLKDGFYDVRPYAYYFASDWDHPQWELYVNGLTWWLIRQDYADSLDGHHFFSYIPTPDAPAARNLPQGIIQARLENLVAEQCDDGGWPTLYDPNWRGWVTTENLLVLQAYGRL